MSTARDKVGTAVGLVRTPITRRAALGTGVASVALMVIGGRTTVAAQGATPPAEAASPIVGATIEVLDSGEPVDAPGMRLVLVRITIEPGGYFEAHGHPGAQIWYVERGAFSTSLLEGTMRITRPSDGATPTPTEVIGPGMEITVAMGESAFFDRDVVHTVENRGDESAVFFISALVEADQPPIIFHGGHGVATPPS